jgi:hypothetical protein
VAARVSQVGNILIRARVSHVGVQYLLVGSESIPKMNIIITHIERLGSRPSIQPFVSLSPLPLGIILERRHFAFASNPLALLE